MMNVEKKQDRMNLHKLKKVKCLGREETTTPKSVGVYFTIIEREFLASRLFLPLSIVPNLDFNIVVFNLCNFALFNFWFLATSNPIAEETKLPPLTFSLRV